MSTPFVIPDSINPVEGWKVLNFDSDGNAYSPTILSEWIPQKRKVAECGQFKHAGHEAPHPGCSCGVYMVTTTQQALGYANNGDSALVRIKGWGRIVPGTRGWRVEYAYPDRIYLLHGQSEKYRKQLEEQWGVEVIQSSFDEMWEQKVPLREALSINMLYPALFCLAPAVVNVAIMVLAGFALSNLIATILSLIATLFILWMHIWIRRM